jgi:redox-sensing transcriptional repressor
MITKEVTKSNGKSGPAIGRLSEYLRTLAVLEQTGVEVISSQELGGMEGKSATQVRKDLSSFGCFGRRGLGYSVSQLKAQITGILGVDRIWNLVLIGAGQLSEVFINSEAFKRNNFCVRKIFDNAPALIGKKIEGITVLDIGDLEKEINAETDDLAIIAMAPRNVQSIIDRLGKIGIKGVLYFAARAVNAPKNMIVVNQDISVTLGIITYHITNRPN